MLSVTTHIPPKNIDKIFKFYGDIQVKFFKCNQLRFFYYLLVAGCADDGPASNRPLFDADSPALGSSNLSIITFRFSSLTLFSLPLVSLPALDSGAGEPDLELKKFLEQ